MIWKPVFGGRYEVSEYGDVRRLAPARGTYVGKVIKPYPIENGYLKVVLYGGGKPNGSAFLVSRLVAIAFLGPPPSDKRYEADHIDNDPTNNHYTNMQWLTASENRKKQGKRIQDESLHSVEH